MKHLTRKELSRLIDISTVRADSTLEEVNLILEEAKKNNFICVFAMPCFTSHLIHSLEDNQHVGVGGIVGFPSGGETTASKVFQAKEMKVAGCKEIDMVMNIGKLKSGLYEEVLEDIRQVKAAVATLPLKVIIEVSLLTDEEIRKAAALVLESKADFVKTGTGWAGATTLHHIEIIKEITGDKIKLKVAGGVRSLETVEAMYNAGVCRFGIGYKSALSILEECIARQQHG